MNRQCILATTTSYSLTDLDTEQIYPKVTRYAFYSGILKLTILYCMTPDFNEQIFPIVCQACYANVDKKPH